MSRIFWDSNLFIYLIEEYGPLSARTKELATRMAERKDHLLTSTLTLGEVLVRPRMVGSAALCARYEEVLDRRAFLIPFGRESARLYASIRGDRSIKAPDAIQLACAAQERVDLFITNDDRLSQKTIPGIHFITSLEKAAQIL